MKMIIYTPPHTHTHTYSEMRTFSITYIAIVKPYFGMET